MEWVETGQSMIKYFITFLLLFTQFCSSLPEKKSNAADLMIVYRENPNIKKLTIEVDDDKKFLIITNPESGNNFQISFRDFKIMSAAYKNWRVAESKDPIITRIEQKEGYLHITFNYLDGEGGSVLSGVIMINEDYINLEETNYKYAYGALGATVLYGVVMLIILL